MSFMYILKCNDGSFYVGSTFDLNKRILEHQNGEGAIYTKSRLPVELFYFEEFNHIQDAFDREKQVQKWSRTKKLALIAGQFDELNSLSKKCFDTPL